MVNFASKALVHAVLFYIVWYVVVSWMGNGTYELIAIFLQVSFIALFVRRAEINFIILVTGVGTMIDSVPVYLGLIEFPETRYYIGVYPVWMTLMWSIFATSFSTSLAWLKGKISLQVMFGAIGGPLSLYAGSLLGALNFPEGKIAPLALCSIEWGFVMYFFMHHHQKIEQ